MDFIFNFIANTSQLAGQLNSASRAFADFGATSRNAMDALQQGAKTGVTATVTRYEAMRNEVARLRNEIVQLRNLPVADLMARFGTPNASLAISAARAEVRRLNLAVGDLQVAIRGGVASSKQFRHEQASVKKATQLVTNEIRAYENLLRTQLQATLQNAANSINTIRTATGSLARGFAVLTVAAAAYIAAFVPIIQSGIEFEQSIARLVSVNSELIQGTKEAREALEGVTGVILHLGATTNFMASEVAQAARVLAQAGLTVNEITAALPATLNLANAGFIELGEAASVAADFMNAFGLAGWEISRVADAMAKAQAVSNTNIEQLTHAFSFASATAASFGQRIEDIAVGLAALANSGIKASRAGTGISQILSSLAKDAEKTDLFMRRLGSSFDAVNPSAVGFVDIIKEFQRVGLQAGDAFKFFGVRAGRTMLALQNVSGEVLAQLEEDINNSFGTAIDQAINNWDNLAGSVKQFQSIVERLGLTFFKTFNGNLKVGIDVVVDALRRLNTFLEDSPFAPIVAGAALAAASLAAVSVALGVIITPLLLVAAAVAGVATNLIGLQVSTLAANSALASATLAYDSKIAATSSHIAALRLETAELRADARAHLLAGNAAAAAAAQTERAAKIRELRATRSARARFAQGAASVADGAPRGLAERLRAGGPISVVTESVNALSGAISSAVGFVWRFKGTLAILTVTVAAVATALTAMFTSLKDSDEIDATTTKIETLSGILEFLKATWDRIAAAFLVGFNRVTDKLSDFSVSSEEAMDSFNTFGTELWTTVLGLVDAFGSLYEVTAPLAGMLAGMFVVAFVTVIELVTMLLKYVNVLIREFISFTNVIREWLGLPVSDAFEELSEHVGTAIETLEDYNKAILQTRDASDRTLSSLQEFAGLLERIDDLGQLDSAKLLELVDKFGGMPEAIAATKKEIAFLKQDIEDTRAAGGSENDIRARTERLARAEKILDALNRAQADNNVLTRDGFRGLRERTAAEKELAALQQEQVQRAKDLKAAEKDLQAAFEEAGDLRRKDINDQLQGLDDLAARTKAAADEKTALVEADIELIKQRKQTELEEFEAKEAAHERERQALKDEEAIIFAQGAELFDREDRVNAAPQSDDADAALAASKAQLQGQLDALKKREDEWDRKEANLATERERFQTSQDKHGEAIQDKRDSIASTKAGKNHAFKVLAAKKKEMLQEQAANELAFIRAQKITQAKEAGDRVKAAELENEAFLETERERIDKLFALNDAATQARKAQAIKGMEEIAAAQLQSVKDDVAADLKKEQDKKKKEDEAAVKKQKSPEDDVRKKAASHLASQVRSTSQLLALNSALDILEQRREGRAKHAVRLYQLQKEKLDRMIKAQQAAAAKGVSSDTLDNMAKGIEKVKAAANIAKAIAGKKLSKAGISESAANLTEGVIGAGSDPSGLSAAMTAASPVMVNLAAALNNFVLNIGPGNLAPPLPVIAAAPGEDGQQDTAGVHNTNEITFNIKNETDGKKLVATIKQVLNDAAFGPV